jgi:transaldolase/glucose-6-phosphate isomerase
VPPEWILILLPEWALGRRWSVIKEKAMAEASGVKSYGTFKYSLGSYEKDVMAKLEQYASQGSAAKIWKKDASFWTGADEARWLGWLDVVKDELGNLAVYSDVAAEIKKAGFKQAILLGMGGSSLCVEVLRRTFGINNTFPDMHVLDSTVPAQVLSARKALDMKDTLVIIATKSGSTTEPNVLCDYFYDEMKKAVGDKVGEHFIAITDPDSSMEATAAKLKFRKVFHGVPAIGGRFSALSNFGMIPSAVMGIDVAQLLNQAQKMVDACAADKKADENPGLLLGTIMGVLASKGRDKVTIFASPGISSLGAWLEQLFAESTGKDGKGLIPVDQERLSEPDLYGQDRLFIYVRLSSAPDLEQDAMVRNLMMSGDPVVFIEMAEPIDIGAEFFRFEFATAVAGAVIGINAFNQPNVQESKDFTKKFLAEWESKGKLPDDILLYEEDGIKLYVDKANQKALEKAVGHKKSLDAYIQAHLARLQAGDYFATNAYIERDAKHEQALNHLRTLVMDEYLVATTVGFGPRFLHSTGQLHKGGPNSGVFLQLTSDDKEDLPIPGQKFTFGILKQAQALGDFVALSNRNRRLLRVHLSAHVEQDLSRIIRSIEWAISQRTPAE